MISLVRVPYLSEYNRLDVREEPVISSLAGYLDALEVEHQTFDFHLDRSVDVETIAAAQSELYVVGVRGTGLHWKYAERVTHHLLQKTAAKVIVYGQTGKLQHWQNPDSRRVAVVPHDEAAFSIATGLPHGPTFRSGLRHKPYGLRYLPALGPRARLFKGTFETTRGCHYGCRFCFINHGSNYAERFARRNNDDVLADMRAYIEHGVSQFWFYDSEFIGGDKRQFPTIHELLHRIRHELPPVEIMIYSRADTLENFAAYDELRGAGVNSVLLGIESLSEADLKAMRKGQSSAVALSAIKNLRANGIFCNLSFILFNKTATIESLQRNIDVVIELFQEPGFVFCGQTHYFSYAFESDWAPNDLKRSLSGRTRLGGSTASTRASGVGVTFDPALEPFAEICRILNYEQVRKLCELTLAKEEHATCSREAVHRWATLLTRFTLNLMTVALDEFRHGRLTVDTLADYEAWVFQAYRKFNAMILPAEWAHTLTDRMSDAYPAGDWNGWGLKIPAC